MISNERAKYSSSSEWLSALRQDEAWLLQEERLLSVSSSDMDALRKKAVERMGDDTVSDYWEIYNHNVEKTIQEAWDTGMSLVKLKIHAIGVLTLEWLEQQTTTTKKTKLESDEAKKYWLRLKEAGFVDAKCTLMPETTRKQAMYIAELFAEKIGIKSKWKTFEQLWSISNLAQEKWDMQETGSTPSRSKDINKIFED
jgi:hypothetical protein